MALCAYCKVTGPNGAETGVEIAWHSQGGKWVACLARVDGTGAVQRERAKVDKTGRTALRPVADPSLPHYPVPAGTLTAIAAGQARGSYCPEWTPTKAAASQKDKSKGKPLPGLSGLIGQTVQGTRQPTFELPKPWTRGPEAETNAPPADDSPWALKTPQTTTPVPVFPPTVASYWDPQGVKAAEAEALDALLEDEPKAPSTPPKLPTVNILLPLPARAAWLRAEKAIACDAIATRVLLWGPPGTGKTELPWRIAQDKGWTHVYQLMTEETPGTELLGHLVVQGGSTVWCDGTLGRAIRASQTGPAVLVIDEIARASQDAMSACLLALTNPESLRLTLRTGEVIEPKPENWHVVATSNDEPKVLPPALQDRLHISINLVSPHPGLVESLTTAEARRLVCALSREFSVRAVLTYDRLRAKGWTLEDASALVWEPTVAQAFRDATRLGGGR